MKGISKQIERLGLGEQVTLYQTKRENIYTIARRKGITVKAEKMLNGFLVTRTGTLGERAEAVTREPIDDKQAKLAALRDLMTQPKAQPVSEPEQDQWEYESFAWDDAKGEYYAIEKHIVTRQKRPSSDPKYSEHFPS